MQNRIIVSASCTYYQQTLNIQFLALTIIPSIQQNTTWFLKKINAIYNMIIHKRTVIMATTTNFLVLRKKKIRMLKNWTI